MDRAAERSAEADPARLLSLAERKAKLMADFLEATRVAVALDIDRDNEEASAEFVRIITARESIICEIDHIDRELAEAEPQRNVLSEQESHTIFHSLEQAQRAASEAMALSRDLEAMVKLACGQLQAQGIRAGTSLQGGGTYANEGTADTVPRFLDTRS